MIKKKSARKQIYIVQNVGSVRGCSENPVIAKHEAITDCSEKPDQSLRGTKQTGNAQIYLI